MVGRFRRSELSTPRGGGVPHRPPYLREAALLDAFGYLEAVRAADLEDLVAVRGIGPGLAARIQSSLSGNVLSNGRDRGQVALDVLHAGRVVSEESTSTEPGRRSGLTRRLSALRATPHLATYVGVVVAAVGLGLLVLA